MNIGNLGNNACGWQLTVYRATFTLAFSVWQVPEDLAKSEFLMSNTEKLVESVAFSIPMPDRSGTSLGIF